jgi:hypothetical protein
MKKLTLDLECQLTAEELQDRGQQISTAMVRYDEVEEAKKAANAEASEEMKGLRAKMSELAHVIRKKAETRPIECVVRFHTPEVGVKRIIRKDIGEIVRDQPMTESERQNNLFDDVDELNKLYGDGPEPPAPAA